MDTYTLRKCSVSEVSQSISWSPHDPSLLIGGRNSVSVVDVGPTNIQTVQRIAHNGEVLKVLYGSMQYQMMAALSGKNHRVCMWDLPKYPKRATGIPLPTYTLVSRSESEVSNFDYSQEIAGGFRNGLIAIWRPELEEEVLPAEEWQAHNCSIVDIKWNPYKAELLASISEKNNLRVDDLHRNSRYLQITTPEAPTSFSWNQANPSVAATSTALGVDLWDLRTPGAIIHHVSISDPGKVEWSPHAPASFAVASGCDLIVYDSKMFAQSFRHNMSSPLCDFSWSKYWDSMLCSIDNNRGLDIFRATA